MKSKWKLENLFGSDTFRHAALLLAPAGVLLLALASGSGLAAGISSVFLVVALIVYLTIGRAQRDDDHFSLRGFNVRDVMQQRFRVLTADTSARDALESLFASGQNDFPVVSGPYFVGMISRTAILTAVKGGDAHRTVAELMRAAVSSVEDASPLAPAVTRVQASPHGSLPVTRSGQLVGVLTRDNVRRWLQRQEVRMQPTYQSTAA